MTTASTGHDRHTVLIVDDDRMILGILRNLLERDDHDVLTASTGEEALAITEVSSPCIVLTDVNMPGMDGLTLCRRLKADPRTRHVPVVLVTGRVSENDVTEGMCAGAVDYIKKPFDKAETRMRVRTQIQLHESLRGEQKLRRQLRVISSAAKDAILIMDDLGAIAHWNEAAEAMFGWSRQEALGENLHRLIVPAQFREQHDLAFPRFQKTGQGSAVGSTIELIAVNRSGAELPVELSLSAVSVDGRWQAVGIIRDITQRKHDEGELLMFKKFSDASSLGVGWACLDGRVGYANDSLCHMFGEGSPGDIIGKSIMDYYAPETRQRLEHEIFPKIIERGQWSGELEILNAHGKTIPTLNSLFALRDERGEPSSFANIVTDITERRRLESELSHARKLEAVGQLAAGIAHEINTPAQFVSDSTHFLKEAFEDQRALIDTYRGAARALEREAGHEELRGEIAEAEETADLEYLEEHVPASLERCFDGLTRIASIVGAMKEFAHPDQRDKSPADLNQAIRATLIICRNEYKFVADVETELGELPPVLCHVGDLNQVFLNLIVNAAHAIGDVVRDTEDRGVIRLRSRRDDDAVSIEIEDTGGGIPPEIRGRVFDPFFTTKDVGAGSGQGLAIAHDIIVDKHGGTLSFDTKEGGGTTFIIRLPVRSAENDQGQEAS